MTLENCERLLKHFEEVGNKEQAEEFRKRVAHKKTLPKYAKVAKETKSTGKK